MVQIESSTLSVCHTYSQEFVSKYRDKSSNAPNDHSNIRLDVHVRTSAHSNSPSEGGILDVNLSGGTITSEVCCIGQSSLPGSVQL